MSEWLLVYEGFDPQQEGLREALCALGNGYFVTRGAAPEAIADDVHYPGTYVAGVYNRLSSEISGRVVHNASLVNVPNWLPLTFRADGGPWFGTPGTEVLAHRLELDMLRGVLTRQSRLRDPDGRTVARHPAALREHARRPPRGPRDDLGRRGLVGAPRGAQRAGRHGAQLRCRPLRIAARPAPGGVGDRPGERRGRVPARGDQPVAHPHRAGGPHPGVPRRSTASSSPRSSSRTRTTSAWCSPSTWRTATRSPSRRSPRCTHRATTQ